MSFKVCCIICLSLLVFASQAVNALAGHVVTGETREWARKALQKETALQSIGAKNTLAVLYFRNKSGQEELDPLQKGFALMLATDLASVKGLQIIERIKLQALAEEIGLGISGLVEPDTAPRVGKLLRAQWLAGGVITGTQLTRLHIQSDLLDVPTTGIVGQSVSEGILAELFRMEKDILFSIVKLLKIEVTPDEEARLRKPCSTNIKALFSLFEGMEASDREEYDKAAKLYEKAVENDPGICIANDALNELHDLGLISEKKKSTDLLRSLRENTSLTNQLTPKDEIKKKFTPKDVPTTTNIQLIFPAPAPPAVGK